MATILNCSVFLWPLGRLRGRTLQAPFPMLLPSPVHWDALNFLYIEGPP